MFSVNSAKNPFYSFRERILRRSRLPKNMFGEQVTPQNDFRGNAQPGVLASDLLCIARCPLRLHLLGLEPFHYYPAISYFDGCP